jgi:Zn-dependent protease
MMDDILTSVAGPVSNFIVATGALLLLGGISLSSASGHTLVMGLVAGGDGAASDSALAPAAMLLYELMIINIVLAVFNLIPVPPLDGSHVLRHFLPDSARRVYDRIGFFALLALVYLAPGLISGLIGPPVRPLPFDTGEILNGNSFDQETRAERNALDRQAAPGKLRGRA